MEQVIDGSLNSIGSPDTALVSLARDEEGAKAVYGRLSRLCPSAAVGLRQ